METPTYEGQQDFPHSDYVPARNNGFMIASLIMGIFAILTSSTLIGGLICGGLGILFAILSCGNDQKFTGTALGGIVTSIIGLIFSFSIFAMAFYIIFSDGELHDRFNETYEQLYGVTIEEMLNGETPSMSPYSIDDSVYDDFL